MAIPYRLADKMNFSLITSSELALYSTVSNTVCLAKWLTPFNTRSLLKPKLVRMKTVLLFLFPFQVNEYTFMGSNSIIFVLPKFSMGIKLGSTLKGKNLLP